jgi:hypothetical protein
MDINRIEEASKIYLERILRSKGEYLTYVVNMDLCRNLEEEYVALEAYED